MSIKYSFLPYAKLELNPETGGFLFNERTGTSYTLNQTAAFIFSHLKRNNPLEEIANALFEHYDVDEAQSLVEVRDFCEHLINAGLLKKEKPTDKDEDNES